MLIAIGPIVVLALAVSVIAPKAATVITELIDLTGLEPIFHVVVRLEKIPNRSACVPLQPCLSASARPLAASNSV